jgi:hypothetical protein
MIARSSLLVAALLGSSAMAGCGHTEAYAALLRAPQARTSGPVELYVADQAGPTRPFYELAIVQAIGFGEGANPEDVTRSLTDKAAALGCDAVVHVYIDVGYTRAHAAGVCVKYLGPAPQGEAPHRTTLPPGPPSNPPPPPMSPAPAPRIEALPSAPNRGR